MACSMTIQFSLAFLLYWTLCIPVTSNKLMNHLRTTHKLPSVAGRQNISKLPSSSRISFEVNLRKQQRKLEIKRKICVIIGCEFNKTVATTPVPVPPTRRPVLPREIEETLPVFSEPTDKTNDTNCMQFRLPDVYFRSGVELSGADIYVYIKIKRQRKHRKRNIVLRISKMFDSHKRKTIARLRFQPNVTKWYRIPLPVTLIRKLQKLPDKKLQLCIQCKKCNRKMRITFPLATSRGRKRRGKRKRNGRSKHKNKRRKSYRNLPILRKNRPFLICHVQKDNKKILNSHIRHI